MRIKNKYIILPVVSLTAARVALIVGKKATQRKNIAGTKYVVKLPVNVQTIPNEFASLQAYNHNNILVEIRKPEWTSDELI